MSHQLPLRIYYEDTDAGGVVYYANYLKFAERARTEWLRELGISQAQLRQQEGVFFVVRKCEIDYQAPAFLDDEIVVESCLQELGNASIAMLQEVKRREDGRLLAQMKVVVVCVNEALKASRLPPSIRRAFA